MTNHEDESGLRGRAHEVVARAKKYAQRTLLPEHTLFREPLQPRGLPREIRHIDENEIVIAVDFARNVINLTSNISDESEPQRDWREIKDVVDKFGLPETESYIISLVASLRVKDLKRNENRLSQPDPTPYTDQNPSFQDLRLLLQEKNFPEANMLSAYGLGKGLGDVLVNRSENPATNLVGAVNNTRSLILKQGQELLSAIQMDNVMRERLEAGSPPAS